MLIQKKRAKLIFISTYKNSNISDKQTLFKISCKQFNGIKKVIKTKRSARVRPNQPITRPKKTMNDEKIKKILSTFIFIGLLTSGITYKTFNFQVEKDNSSLDLNLERPIYINDYDSFTINFVQQTSDGGQIATGVACKDGPESFFSFIWDVLLVKIDLNGYVEWFQTYETPENERGLCVRQTDDGGYIIASYKFFNYIEGYAWLLKTDSHGNIEWDKTYDSWIGAWDIARSVYQTPDGGYLIAGCLTNENVDSSFADWSAPTDAYIIKTDSAGEEIWRKAFFEDQDFFGSTFNSIEKTSDGGYIITGTGYHFENDPITFDPIDIESILLLKLDFDGDELWRTPASHQEKNILIPLKDLIGLV